MKKMICEKCKEVKKTSKVSCLGSSSTLMYCQPFYDEEGEYHHHDLNKTTTMYKCSEGHVFTIKEQHTCPTCDWRSSEKEEIVWHEQREKTINAK